MSSPLNFILRILFLLSSISFLLFVLHKIQPLRDIHRYLLIDFVFLFVFYRKTGLANTSILKKFYKITEIFYILVFTNLISSLFVKHAEYHTPLYHDATLIQIIFLSILSFLEHTFFFMLPYLLLLTILLPPISIISVYLPEFFNLMFFLSANLFLYTVLFRKKYSLFSVKNLDQSVYILGFAILLHAILQFFVTDSPANITFHIQRLFLYAFTLLIISYFLKREKILSFLFLFSLWFFLFDFITSFHIVWNLHKYKLVLNENHISLTYAWIIPLSLFIFLYVKNLTGKTLFGIAYFFMIVFNILIFRWWDSKTAIYTVFVTFFLLGSVYLLTKTVSSKFLGKTVFFVTLILIFFISFVFFFDNLKSGNSSLGTRVYFWIISFWHLAENPVHFFTGTGEYLNFFIYRYINESSYETKWKIFIDFWVPVNHLHNDAVSFLFSGGIFFLILYIYVFIRALFNAFSLLPQRIHFLSLLGIVLLASFYGITEPFAFSYETGFIFWLFTFLSICCVNKNSKLPEAAGVNVKLFYKISFVIVTIVYFYSIFPAVFSLKMFFSYFSRDIHLVHNFLAHKQIPVLENGRDEEMFIIRLRKLFEPVSSLPYQQSGDYYILKYSVSNDKNYLDLAREEFCKAFDRKKAPVSYLRLQWIAKELGRDPFRACDENTNEKLTGYDRYRILVPYYPLIPPTLF